MAKLFQGVGMIIFRKRFQICAHCGNITIFRSTTTTTSPATLYKRRVRFEQNHHVLYRMLSTANIQFMWCEWFTVYTAYDYYGVLEGVKIRFTFKNGDGNMTHTHKANAMWNKCHTCVSFLMIFIFAFAFPSLFHFLSIYLSPSHSFSLVLSYSFPLSLSFISPLSFPLSFSHSLSPPPPFLSQMAFLP